VNKTDTLRAITDNLTLILKAEGLHLPREEYADDKNVPSSLFPYGIISYEGETFEYTHGQRAGYSDATFTVKVALRSRDHMAKTNDEQIWVHRIREALTVKALNAGKIQALSPVSRVVTEAVKVEQQGYVSRLIYSLRIRYR